MQFCGRKVAQLLVQTSFPMQKSNTFRSPVIAQRLLIKSARIGRQLLRVSRLRLGLGLVKSAARALMVALDQVAVLASLGELTNG